MKKLNKLKELVLILVSIILAIFIIRYLKLVHFVCLIFRILAPVFIGFIYAWLVNPFINKLSKKYRRSIVSIGLFVVIILLLCLFLYFLIPIIYKEIHEVVDLMPSFLEIINGKISKIGLNGSLEKIGEYVLSNLPGYLLDMVKVLFKYLGVFMVGLILGLYMSMDYDKMVGLIYKCVPKKIKCVFIELSQEVSCEVRKCVNGTLLVAFMVFVMDTICFVVLKLEAPILLGLFCGITDLIPYVGPYIGGGVAVLVGFTESKTIGIITIICCVVVQSIENYILQPIVMSKSIKISPILVIIGLLVFGNLFGIFGMILATPIVAVIKVIAEHFYEAINKCKK